MYTQESNILSTKLSPRVSPIGALPMARNHSISRAIVHKFLTDLKARKASLLEAGAGAGARSTLTHAYIHVCIFCDVYHAHPQKPAPQHNKIADPVQSQP